ncbi:hypothetical protein [Accumulibacter sp.]|uniref:hypothetical protein n=1 Tax=Accumulibacter sp. TaxID=2053492 RepID=UPI001A3B80A2|nr:hypothetical protein [Accumulibacter sp.]MBL8401293.1 hypothetical protein [Accumulibacter sp.]
MSSYPSITVKELREHLSLYSDDCMIDFSGLEFYRLKQRGENSVQMEFNQQVYRTPEGRVVVENLD